MGKLQRPSITTLTYSVIFEISFFFIFTDSKFSNVLKAKEDMNKSAEQLEKEKREILAQRIPKLVLDSRYKNDLIEIVIYYKNKKAILIFD
jgi:hypothetical protein